MNEQERLDVLLIAADIIDETGRDVIADQLRQLHQELQGDRLIDISCWDHCNPEQVIFLEKSGGTCTSEAGQLVCTNVAQTV